MARVNAGVAKNGVSIGSQLIAIGVSFVLVLTLFGSPQAFGDEEERSGDLGEEVSAGGFFEGEQATLAESVGVLPEDERVVVAAMGDASPEGEHIVLAATADTTWYDADPSAAAFSIGTLDELLGLVQLVNSRGVNFSGKTITLTASIDAADAGQWVPIGKGVRSGRGFVPDAGATGFAGTFNGGGFTIRNLTITTSQGTADYAYGLFGGVVGGTVTDLTFEKALINVSGSALSAAAIGLLTGGGIASNITVDATSAITATNGSGAIVGRMTDWGTIENCTNNAPVTGSSTNIGGIVGAAYYTPSDDKEMNIIGCTNNGAVTGIGTGAGVIGGIAGLSVANVMGCTNTAPITGVANGVGSVGGIIGEQQIWGVVSGNNNDSGATVIGSMAGGIIGWVRYSSYVPANYGRFGVVSVTDNENHASIESLDGGLRTAGGIIGSVYDYAVIAANRNYAPRIVTYNFASGIAGSIQQGNYPYAGTIDQSVLVKENLNTTPLSAMTKASGGTANADLHAYNNVPGFANVIDNYLAIPTTSEEALALINSAAGSGVTPTRQTVDAVVNTLHRVDQGVLDGLNTAEASTAITQLEEAAYAKNNSTSDPRVLRPTLLNHDPAATPGLLSEGSVKGAALSVTVLSSGTRTASMQDRAVTNLVAPTYIPTDSEIPVHLKSGSPKILFDTTLDIVNESDTVVAQDTQPKVPLTLTFNLDGAVLGEIDPANLIVINYHKDETTQEMIPTLTPILAATKVGSNYQVTTIFTQLSTVLIGLKATDFTVAADNVDVPYDKAAHGVVAAAYLDGVAEASAAITYYDGIDYTLASSPTFTNATQGVQTVLFKASLSGYPDAYGQATVTVSQAALTVAVTGNSAKEAYTGKMLSVTGFDYDNKDKVSVTTKPGVSAYVEGIAIGTYTMGLEADSFVATDLSGGNYSLTLAVTDGSLEIVQAQTPAATSATTGSGGSNASRGSSLAPTEDPLSSLTIEGLAVLAAGAALVLIAMGFGARTRGKQRPKHRS